MTGLGADELDRLAAFLVDAGADVAGPISATLLVGGRSNLTYRLDDGRTRWALRRPPTGGLIESAHDVVREYRVVAALGRVGVPVARAVACDESGVVFGAPCAIVGFVDGRTARSRADTATWSPAEFAACTGAMLDALVMLHSVDPEEAGLGDFGRPGSYAGRQLRRWSGQWQRMGADDPRADRLHELLAERVPDQDRTTVVHGDYRVDNVILAAEDPGRVLAIVDWELSTLGDPVADVATMAAYRHSALDQVLGLPAAWAGRGFPTADEIRAAYEERVGRDLTAWGFHVALAYFKLAVIAEGIAYRHRLGATAGDGYEDVAGAVPRLLEAGLAEAARHGREA